MTHSPKRAAILASALALLALGPHTAHAASDKDLGACSAAFSAGPDLVKSGKLIAARAELTRCAADPCPSNMRTLCADDLRKLEERIPTVVFSAKGARGEDLSDVRVSEQGKVVVETLDGRSIAVDPGSHTFHFERAGSAVDVTAVVREGETSRPIQAQWARIKSAPRSSPRPRSVETRPVPWTVYVAGGVTVVAAASFGYFGARGLSERSDLDRCKGECDHDSVDRARTHFTIADASLVTGVVALGVTTVLYFTRPTERR